MDLGTRLIIVDGSDGAMKSKTFCASSGPNLGQAFYYGRLLM